MARAEPSRSFRLLRCCAATGLALTVVVVYASAAIRLWQAAAPPIESGVLAVLRAAHRTAASLEVAAALLFAWLAWRARADQRNLVRAAALALALTVFLSVLGIAAGRQPPPAAALANLLAGLALAAAFAWTLGLQGPHTSQPRDRLRRLAAALLVAQCALGASLATLPGARVSAAVPLHGIAGIVVAAIVFRLALRAASPAARTAGLLLATLVPLAGFSVLHFEGSAGAAFVHAAAAAALVVAAANSRLRPA